MSVNSPSTEHEDELSGYPFIMEEGTVKLNHHKDVQANHVKVSVDEVFEGYEDKPLPAVKTIGEHWVFLVICLQKRYVHVFDPVNTGKRKYDIKAHLIRVLKVIMTTKADTHIELEQ
ncbi:hypothetical protein OROMI_011146 [Orobanche minor]